ncbi:mercuric transporter MerT family protein [Lentibacter algarum]|uniref:mercuric transporter MerT family protein n=1 Tax=Lentibacter algarum TaxID=576131 RepID=UPI003AF89A27
MILFSLGVSGAWIGNLVALEPYKPIFNRYHAWFSRVWLLDGLSQAQGMCRGRHLCAANS